MGFIKINKKYTPCFFILVVIAASFFTEGSFCNTLALVEDNKTAPEDFIGEKTEAGNGMDQTPSPDMDIPASLPVFDEGTYTIGAGDVIQIITWKEPDFSRDALVRIDGMITFPLLDDVKAAGKTPMELKKHISQRLTEYITKPMVTVSVKAPSSQKFYILGEVGRTGEYPLLKNLTVLQAFALAGGFTEWASKKEIILVRRVGGEDKIIRVNYKEIVKGEGFGSNILIETNDTIIVP